MKVKIAAVGKLKKGYIKEGVCDYCRRLSKYINIEMIEVKEEKTGEKTSKSGEELIKQREAARLLSVAGEKCIVVCLDVKGDPLSTEKLTEFIKSKKSDGTKELIFVIGGHLGLGSEVLKRADYTISLSEMTFPHELARLMLAEQLYRAEKILNGEPYHR